MWRMVLTESLEMRGSTLNVDSTISCNECNEQSHLGTIHMIVNRNLKQTFSSMSVLTHFLCSFEYMVVSICFNFSIGTDCNLDL